MERMTAENAAAIEDRERLEREKAAQQATKIATEKEKRKTHLDTDVAEDFNFKEANKRQVIAAEEQEAFTGLENKFKKERDLALKRQYEREAATKKFEDETKKRTTALTNASKQRQVIIDEQAADFSRIKTQFADELSKIQESANARAKITVKFPGGVEFIARKDVLDLFKGLNGKVNTAGELSLNLRPSIFKKIYNFFEAALTKDSDGRTLVSTERNSKHEYKLFEKDLNVINFIKKNLEILTALNIMTNTPFINGNYVWSKPVYNFNNNNDTLGLLANQVFRSSSFRAGKIASKDINLFQSLIEIYNFFYTKSHDSKRDDILAVFGEVSNKIYIETFMHLLKKLNDLDISKYQSVADICGIITNVLRDRVDNPLMLWVLLDQLNPELYPFIANFFVRNPTFLTSVPYQILCERIRSCSSEQQLQGVLQNLYLEYNRTATQATPQGLAFEIHDFANQAVVDVSTGTSGKFNDVVFSKVKAKNAEAGRSILEFYQVSTLMRTTVQNMLDEDQTLKNKGKKRNILLR